MCILTETERVVALFKNVALFTVQKHSSKVGKWFNRFFNKTFAAIVKMYFDDYLLNMLFLKL